MNRRTKRLLSVLLTLVMLLGLLPTTALAASAIDKVELTITPPAIGQVLDFAPDTEDAPKYNVYLVEWYKDWGEHGNMRCSETHEAEPGVPYTVRIYINPNDGYSFADLEEVNVTVNGSTDGVRITHNELYTGIICSVAFDELGYTVSFDANGGTGDMADVTKVYDDYTLPECGFTAPEGKEFNGWTVGSTDGAWYYSGSTLEVNANIKLYAKWADPTGSHTLTFIDPAWDPAPTKEILVSEGMYTLPKCLFTAPDGYVFDYWAADTDGIGGTGRVCPRSGDQRRPKPRNICHLGKENLREHKQCCL